MNEENTIEIVSGYGGKSHHGRRMARTTRDGQHLPSEKEGVGDGARNHRALRKIGGVGETSNVHDSMTSRRNEADCGFCFAASKRLHPYYVRNTRARRRNNN